MDSWHRDNAPIWWLVHWDVADGAEGRPVINELSLKDYGRWLQEI
jgi:hypothetical protein